VEIGFPFKSLAYPPQFNQARPKKKKGGEKIFSVFRYLQENITVPPQPKDQWRINFSRVEYHVTVVDGQYEKVFSSMALFSSLHPLIPHSLLTHTLNRFQASLKTIGCGVHKK
jgi:hypothetical protein